MKSILVDQLCAITDGVPYEITNLSNASALLYHSLKDLNWAGFYLLKDGKLILGPFQGKVACTMIPLGRGVCGSAAKEDKTFRVEDVHQFPGHIACDCASNSEIVIPIHKDGEVYGVLDIDSPVTNRFSESDQEELEAFVGALERILAQ